MSAKFTITGGGRQLGQSRKRIIESFPFSAKEADRAYTYCKDWKKVAECMKFATENAIDLDLAMSAKGILSPITGFLNHDGGILSILNSGVSLIPPQVESDIEELRKLVEESIKAKGITKGKGSGPDDPEAFAEWLKKKP